ncbi:hypothetical protein T4D_6720 [Trichinella pseudospiralis]|uniref:Uncharacterized protein n=1 Tax=Trichinella pseudospiralis TaxID=6337 RepID=A0A0V1G2M2_TRIPS|nr:hypothetical protein T4D_6720 [Trichinella pseudospiralis]
MFIFVFLSPINHHNHHIVRVCFPFIVLSSANQCILCLWLQLKVFVCFLFSSATLVRAALIRRCCTASSLTSVKHLLQLATGNCLAIDFGKGPRGVFATAQRWACVRGKPKVGSSQDWLIDPTGPGWSEPGLSRETALMTVHFQFKLLLDFRPLWHGRPAGLPLAGRPVARLCCPPTGKFLQCSNAVATLARLLARWRILHGRVAVLYFLPQPTSNYH